MGLRYAFSSPLVYAIRNVWIGRALHSMACHSMILSFVQLTFVKSAPSNWPNLQIEYSHFILVRRPVNNQLGFTNRSISLSFLQRSLTWIPQVLNSSTNSNIHKVSFVSKPSHLSPVIVHWKLKFCRFRISFSGPASPFLSWTKKTTVTASFSLFLSDVHTVIWKSPWLEALGALLSSSALENFRVYSYTQTFEAQEKHKLQSSTHTTQNGYFKYSKR